MSSDSRIIAPDPFGQLLVGSHVVCCCALDETRRQVLATTRGLRELFGFGEDQGPFPFAALLVDSDRPIATRALAEASQRSIVHARRADGSTFVAELKFEGALVSVEDISVRHAAEERLRALALHDPLTGLPNRMLLQDRVHLALLEARRDRSLLALMVLDLDRFKDINDEFGHLAGDEVLMAVARRFTSCARATDTVARIGGDEFVVVAPISRRADAALLAGRVVESLATPIPVGEAQRKVGVSVGIALSPDDGDDLDELFVRADAAMYRAKRGDVPVAFADRSRGEVLNLEALAWHPSLKVGVPLVDAQHEELVVALNAVKAAVSSRAEERVVAERLEDLLAATRRHFETEEQLMRQVLYDGLAAHATEHQNLLHDLHLLRTTTDFGGGVTIALRHLDQWLLEHTESFDRDACRFLLAAENDDQQVTRTA